MGNLPRNRIGCSSDWIKQLSGSRSLGHDARLRKKGGDNLLAMDVAIILLRRCHVVKLEAGISLERRSFNLGIEGGIA
jgi:hypothetical protein